MIRRIGKKVAGLRDVEGVTLAEAWSEASLSARRRFLVVVPALLVLLVVLVALTVLEVRENGWTRNGPVPVPLKWAFGVALGGLSISYAVRIWRRVR